jgi:hypothetical protein
LAARTRPAGVEDGFADLGVAHVAREHRVAARHDAALLDAADAIPDEGRGKHLAAPGAVAGVVGELHGVDRPDLGAEPLQGEHRAGVADVAEGDPGLDGKDVHAALPCRARS